jgi:glyoxylase-like metal-dependent hydrolase (beta-lactamase superfamily II)
MSEHELPTGMVDDWGVLSDGYAPWPPEDFGATVTVASTVSFIRAGDRLIVHDPGLVRSRGAILDPLEQRGVSPEDVTDVIISHHHPDHTVNIALFENARTHDVWGIYKDDTWLLRMAEGVEVAPGVSLIQTPGHTEQDITVLASTVDGLVVFTHLWSAATFPAPDDPYAVDNELLHENRARVLALHPALIVPGHGAAFEPTRSTPR